MMESAFLLRESADGQWYYFFQYPKAGLWRIRSDSDLDLNQAELFLPDITLKNSGNWTLHDAGIIYLSEDQGMPVIRSIGWDKQPTFAPIPIDIQLMQVEGHNFAYHAASQRLIVVTNDHYVGNIRQLSFSSDQQQE